MALSEEDFVAIIKRVLNEIVPALAKKAAEDAVNTQMAQFKAYTLGNIDSEVNTAIRDAVGKYYFHVETRLKLE